MNKLDLTDECFLRMKAHEIAELSESFKELTNDIIERDEYYSNLKFQDSIAMRQDCFAVSNSLAAAHSALLNILNQSANIPSNIQKKKESRCQNL